MADIFDKKTRSHIMRKIKGKNTKPEMVVRKFLFSKGIRYRLHEKKLPGTPDIVLKKYNTVIFVNGCFWHGHSNCKYASIPKSRTTWWKKKIERNVFNDEKYNLELIEKGWNIITVWECELKKDKIEETLSNVIFNLNKC